MGQLCAECNCPINSEEELCVTCRRRRRAKRKEQRKKTRAIEHRLALMKERTLELGLRFHFDITDFRELKEQFNNRCALTGSHSMISIDHFIPLSSGHGGTYKGNVFPLTYEYNLWKSDQNPFDWIRTVNNSKILDRWKPLVNYLASLNGLTASEYALYVSWCCSHKRDREQIRRDGPVSSVLLWWAEGLQVSKLKYYTRRGNRVFFSLVVSRNRRVTSGRIVYQHHVSWGKYEVNEGSDIYTDQDQKAIVTYIRYSTEFERALKRLENLPVTNAHGGTRLQRRKLRTLAQVDQQYIDLINSFRDRRMALGLKEREFGALCDLSSKAVKKIEQFYRVALPHELQQINMQLNNVEAPLKPCGFPSS